MLTFAVINAELKDEGGNANQHDTGKKYSKTKTWRNSKYQQQSKEGAAGSTNSEQEKKTYATRNKTCTA